MRLVVQRVSRASVQVRGETVAGIGRGLLILVGVGATDPPGGDEVEWLVGKVFHLRIFEDAGGKMNLALSDVGGEVLVVPQFTLYGDASKGRRPSWIDAAPPDVARERVEAFARALEALGAPVRRGSFQEHMEVELVNDGPVTILLEGRA
jgi:D-tyrosyl-tRNA(Tyr) deacylase